MTRTPPSATRGAGAGGAANLVLAAEGEGEVPVARGERPLVRHLVRAARRHTV